jgi:hypothetical protein
MYPELKHIVHSESWLYYVKVLFPFYDDTL